MKEARAPYAVILVSIALTAALLPARAAATQVHAHPEGLYVHQIAHLFFAFSMGILIYWLRERNLTREAGWRFIQYAALFFILWNVDASIVHYLDGRDDIFEVVNTGLWSSQIHFAEGPDFFFLLYYFAKLDHLLCVPAVVFLYLGLRQLLHQARGGRLEEHHS